MQMNLVNRIVLSTMALLAVIAASSAPAGTGEGSISAGSEKSSSSKVPTFTLDQAILTALQRNPTLLIAEQEIKRTQGVIIQIRAEALPHINASGSFEWTDPNLQGARILEIRTTERFPAGPPSLLTSLHWQLRRFRHLAGRPWAWRNWVVTNMERTKV